MPIGIYTDIIAWENEKTDNVVLGNLRDEESMLPATADLKALLSSEGTRYDTILVDVEGQESLKQALEAATAGSHNLLMLHTPDNLTTLRRSKLTTSELVF